MVRGRRWPPALPLALAAFGGFALQLLLFHPGLMSPDSATQYAQALGLLPLDDVHPPLLALLWRATDAAWPGPGGLFALLALGWWGGLAAFVHARLGGGWRAAGALALVGAWPAALLMAGHLWKDVAMAVALLLALAAGIRWRQGRGPLALAVALLALAAACAFRHNALAAVLPLLAWLLWPSSPAPARWPGRLAAMALAALALALAPAALERAAGVRQASPWTAVLLWDLAPMSVAAGRSLYPPQLVASDLSVAELEAAYVPWSNVPLFATNRIRLSFFVPYDADDRRAVLAAWWSGVREQPRAWLAHRWALSRLLLLGTGSTLPRELVFTPRRQLPAGVDLDLPAPRPDRPPLSWAQSALDTPLFAGWPYLAAALAALAVGWRRRRGDAVALAASAFGNALPLALVSGSAEFRYLLWTVLASLLGLVLALAGDRQAGSASPPAAAHPRPPG